MTALVTLVGSLLPWILVLAILWWLTGALIRGWDWAKASWFGLKPAGRAIRNWAGRDGQAAAAKSQGHASTPAAKANGDAASTGATRRTGRASRGSSGQTETMVMADPAPVRAPRRGDGPVGPSHIEDAGQRIRSAEDTGERHGLATATTVRRGSRWSRGFGRGVRKGAKAPLPERTGLDPKGVKPDMKPAADGKPNDPTAPAQPSTEPPTTPPAITEPNQAPETPTPSTPSQGADLTKPATPTTPTTEPERHLTPEQESLRRTTQTGSWCGNCGDCPDCYAAEGWGPYPGAETSPTDSTVTPITTKEGQMAYQIPSELNDLASVSSTMKEILKEIGAGEDLTAEMQALSQLATEASSITERFGEDIGPKTHAEGHVFEEHATALSKAMEVVLAALQGMAGATEAVRKQAEATRGENAA